MQVISTTPILVKQVFVYRITAVAKAEDPFHGESSQRMVKRTMNVLATRLSAAVEHAEKTVGNEVVALVKQEYGSSIRVQVTQQEATSCELIGEIDGIAD